MFAELIEERLSEQDTVRLAEEDHRLIDQNFFRS